MTDSHTLSDGTQFDDALTSLLEQAYSDGVEIEGGWKCSIDGNGDFHWDVEITQVVYDGG